MGNRQRAAIEASKADLRSRVLAARSALPLAERAEQSKTARANLRDLIELDRARAVSGYAAFGSEVDLDAWLQALADAGRGVFLPWVDGEDLALARVRDLAADLAPGFRGVREPKAIGRRAGRPDRIEAAVVPGVAFDRSGARLGYGGGHFDRFIARLRPGTPVIGVCFDAQLVEAVPVSPHDQRVDIIVTGSAVLLCRPHRDER